MGNKKRELVGKLSLGPGTRKTAAMQEKCKIAMVFACCTQKNCFFAPVRKLQSFKVRRYNYCAFFPSSGRKKCNMRFPSHAGKRLQLLWLNQFWSRNISSLSLVGNEFDGWILAYSWELSIFVEKLGQKDTCR